MIVIQMHDIMYYYLIARTKETKSAWWRLRKIAIFRLNTRTIRLELQGGDQEEKFGFKAAKVAQEA